MVTSVTCGARLSDASERLDRDGSSVRIRPVCLPELVKGTSNEYFPTLPKWGIACRGEYGELWTSERLTSESGCSSAPIGTPTARMQKRSPKFKRTVLAPAEFVEVFPTPLASDAVRMRYSEESLRIVGKRRTNGEYKAAGCNLSEYVAVFPTPPLNSGASNEVRAIGKLNPTWVECLMGFPINWTSLED